MVKVPLLLSTQKYVLRSFDRKIGKFFLEDVPPVLPNVENSPFPKTGFFGKILFNEAHTSKIFSMDLILFIIILN